MQHFIPSIVLHTSLSAGCLVSMVLLYSSNFPFDGRHNLNRWCFLRILTIILLENCRYFDVGDIVIPKISWRTINEQRVRVHIKYQLRAVSGAYVMRLPLLVICFTIYPLSSMNGEYSPKTGQKRHSKT